MTEPAEARDRGRSARKRTTGPDPLAWALPTPSVDEVTFSDLYELEEIPVVTEDGWQLIITRYSPRPQPFAQPLLGAPLMLVHGYTQNRRAWNTGQFVKTMLYFGADVYLLELRGHGKSSVEAQRRRARQQDVPLPADIDYDWDIDSYLMHDLPAAVAKIKQVSGRERIFYCGHSLGGNSGVRPNVTAKLSSIPTVPMPWGPMPKHQLDIPPYTLPRM